MKRESLESIFKIIFVLGFILVPAIINIFAKLKKDKEASNTKNKRLAATPTQPNSVAKRIKTDYRKSVANYQEKPKPQKKVNDILAEIFGDKPSSLTPEREHLPSKTHRQEIHKTDYHAMKSESEELPRFKTSIKDFKVNLLPLSDDIKGFKPDINTSTVIPKQPSPFIQKFKNINKNDLRYGIIISEVLGPPVSLK